MHARQEPEDDQGETDASKTPTQASPPTFASTSDAPFWVHQTPSKTRRCSGNENDWPASQALPNMTAVYDGSIEASDTDSEEFDEPPTGPAISALPNSPPEYSQRRFLLESPTPLSSPTRGETV